MAAAAFACAGAAALLGVAGWLSPLWDPTSPGGASWPFLVAAVLVALGLIGLLARYSIEFEWKRRVTELEHRVAELEK